MSVPAEETVLGLVVLATLWGANAQAGDQLAAENTAHEALRVLRARRERFCADGYGPLWRQLTTFWQEREAAADGSDG